MPYFINIYNPFDAGIYKLRRVIKELRQMPYRNIAIFIEGSRKNTTSILFIKFFHIRSATKKRHTKRCLSNNHRVTSTINQKMHSI